MDVYKVLDTNEVHQTQIDNWKYPENISFYNFYNPT